MKKPDYSKPIIRYEQWYDGEWEHFPLKQIHRLMCCDCGLVHEITLVRKEGKIFLRMKRNDKATAAARRKKKIKSCKH